MKFLLLTVFLCLVAWGGGEDRVVQWTGKIVDSGDLLSGGSDSLAAKAIGHAEGTRSVDGGKTEAYWGHKDPGLQLGSSPVNQGTFSYQHEAATPEVADQKQLEKLAIAEAKLREESEEKGVELNPFKLVAGLDLFNQSEAAATDYVERLNECISEGLEDVESVVCARTKTYYGPTGLDAPGLGDHEAVEQDQRRRVLAIKDVLATNK
jgi:hypothetical protein